MPSDKPTDENFVTFLRANTARQQTEMGIGTSSTGLTPPREEAPVAIPADATFQEAVVKKQDSFRATLKAERERLDVDEAPPM